MRAQDVLPPDSEMWRELVRDTQRWLDRLRTDGSPTASAERRLALLNSGPTTGVPSRGQAGRRPAYKEAFKKVKELRPATPWKAIYAACQQSKLDVPDELRTFIRTMQTKLKRDRETNTK